MGHPSWAHSQLPGAHAHPGQASPTLAGGPIPCLGSGGQAPTLMSLMGSWLNWKPLGIPWNTEKLPACHLDPIRQVSLSLGMNLIFLPCAPDDAASLPPGSLETECLKSLGPPFECQGADSDGQPDPRPTKAPARSDPFPPESSFCSHTETRSAIPYLTFFLLPFLLWFVCLCGTFLWPDCAELVGRKV